MSRDRDHIVDRYVFERLGNTGKVSTLVHKDNANGAIVMAVREARANSERATTERVVKLIHTRVAEWHNRVPDDQPDWREACREITDALERGEHNV